MVHDFDKIIQFINRCGISEADAFIARCSSFKALLYAENEKYNLTRITDEFEFWNRHVADSLSMGIFFSDKLRSQISLADVGCGAGFPSIILAIAYPGLKITAIDSTGKKTAFVDMASKALGLSNIKVVTGRARELKINSEFDIVTARAVAEPLKIFKEVRTWLRQDGTVVLYQTPQNMSEEPSEINKATCGYGIKWKLSDPFVLPGGENRIFLIGRK